MSNTLGALHLRTLATLNDISSDQSNTIVLTIPLEILKAFEGKEIVKKAIKIKDYTRLYNLFNLTIFLINGNL